MGEVLYILFCVSLGFTIGIGAVILMAYIKTRGK